LFKDLDSAQMMAKSHVIARADVADYLVTHLTDPAGCRAFVEIAY